MRLAAASVRTSRRSGSGEPRAVSRGAILQDCRLATPREAGLEYLIFVFSLIVVSFIDFDHMILPNTFTLSGVVIGLVGAWLNPERAFMPAFWGVLFSRHVPPPVTILV